MKGVNAEAEGSDQQAVLYAPDAGLFKFGIRSTPGAVKGLANCGNLKFKLDGQTYTLLTSSQITGGDQPSIVWVTGDTRFSPPDNDLKHGFVSINKLSHPNW